MPTFLFPKFLSLPLKFQMIMKSRTLKKLLTEDWIIVFAGAVILALATIFPEAVPSMPEKLTSASDWLSAGYLFLFVLIVALATYNGIIATASATVT